MRKVLFKLSCFAFMLGMLIPFAGKASHFVGGEITYTYTGVPNTYLITFKFYRDCSGITPPTQIPLCYSSDSCGVTGTIDLFPIPGTGQPIPPSPCVPVPPGGTTCTGGTAYGVEEHIYEATLVLPLTCHDWKFSYEECCRNNISTLAGGPGLYLDAYLNNRDNPTNSSPYFTTIPVTQFCVNNQFYFDQGAFDIDNDSLVYTLINAQDATFGCPYLPFDVTYNTDPCGFPYSGLNPVATTPCNGTTIDPLTGVISFLPSTVQNAVIAVRCTEYDRNTLQVKSRIKREIQINIVNTCVISTPTFDSTLVASGINLAVGIDSLASCDDTTFIIALSIPVQCGSIIPSDIRFLDANGVSNPVVSAVGINCVNGLTDSILVTLINPIAIGTSYIFTKIGFDGNTFLSECGSPMNEFDTIPITLVDSSIYNFVVRDTVDCAFDSLFIQCSQSISCNDVKPDGSDFILTDANGTVITITSATCIGQLPGGLFNNQFVLGVQPTIGAVPPLTLVVKNGSDNNTFSNACGTFVAQFDTVGIIEVRSALTVNLGSDVTACSSDPTPQLFAGSFPSGVTFNWTLGGSPLSDTTATIGATATGQYIVTASANGSCSGIDTVDVNILQAPVVALGSDIQLCTGNPFPTLDAQNSGASFQWFLNGAAISGATQQTYTPSAAGTYMVNVSVGSSCLGIDTVEVTVNPNLVITLPANQTLCSNQSLPTLDAGAIAGATYQWTVNGVANTADTLQTIAVVDTGSYSVLVTNTSGCTGTDSYQISVVDVPVLSGFTNLTLCANQALPTFDAANGTTNGNTTYQWYENGVAISGATNSVYAVTNTNGGTYSVVANNGNNCTDSTSVTITVVQQLDVTINNLAICAGTTANLQSTSPNSGVTYSWYLNGNLLPGETGTAISVNQGGNYQVIITAGTCSDTSNATVDAIAVPTATLSNINQCDNYPLLDPGYVGNANTTYAWTFGGSSTGGNTPTLQTTAANGNGTYAVTITNTLNGVNCTATANMNLVVGVTPTNVVVTGSDTICTATAGGSTVTLAVNPTGATAYQWSVGGNLIVGANDSTYTTSTSGIYTVEVTGTNNCKTSESGTVIIGVNPVAIIQDNSDGKQDSVLFCQGQGVPLLSVVNPEQGFTYSWSFDNISGTDSLFEVNAIGTYNVVVTDAEGCTADDEILVVNGACDIIQYNVITPNGDGKNDVFEFGGLLEYPTRKLTIYNRWGNEVYSSDKYNNDWNGGDLAAGTYFYVLELNNTIKSSTKNGYLQIIK